MATTIESGSSDSRWNTAICCGSPSSNTWKSSCLSAETGAPPESVTVAKPKKMAPVVDLMAALKESLAQLPKKPPQRVEAAQRESEVKAIAKKAKGSRRKPAA